MNSRKTEDSEGIETRVATLEDLPILERELRLATPTRHQELLAQQAQGVITFMVAWQGASPLGHILIHWPGPRDPAVAEYVGRCPELFSLAVREGLRSRGIGRRLMNDLEAIAAARQIVRVGGGVAHSNRRARRFYERLGYREVGAPQYIDRWHWIDSSGKVHFEADPCVFMVHELTQH